MSEQHDTRTVSGVSSTRHQHRRARALRRLDVAIGLAIAALGMALAPGLAMAGIIAVAILLLVERGHGRFAGRRRRR